MKLISILYRLHRSLTTKRTTAPTVIEKHPLVIQCLIATNLLQIDGAPLLNTLKGEVIVPPFGEYLATENDENKLKQSIDAYLGIFVYNILIASDFPLRAQYLSLIDDAERILSKHQDLPWIQQLIEMSKSKQAINFNRWMNTCDSQTQYSLRITRDIFEPIMNSIRQPLLHRLLLNKVAIGIWFVNQSGNPNANQNSPSLTNS